jgi:carbon-monoxide dehydrogenase large subunit
VKDVGGGFGLKLHAFHAFADEMAIAAIATMLPIPVKYTADRLEAFVSEVCPSTLAVTFLASR